MYLILYSFKAFKAFNGIYLDGCMVGECKISVLFERDTHVIYLYAKIFFSHCFIFHTKIHSIFTIICFDIHILKHKNIIFIHLNHGK